LLEGEEGGEIAKGHALLVKRIKKRAVTNLPTKDIRLEQPLHTGK